MIQLARLYSCTPVELTSKPRPFREPSQSPIILATLASPVLEQLICYLVARTSITICTSCYHNLRSKLKESGDCNVMMLPELVMEAMSGQ